jgi:hypothetical protein
MFDSDLDAAVQKALQVSSTRSILHQQKNDEAAAIQQKMQGKLHQAAAKKERHRLQFPSRCKPSLPKSEMFAEQMAAATTRKSLLDSESQEKVEGNGSKRQELAVSFQKSKDANVSTKKLELDGNLASAVERKQALMDAKTAKVTEYLTRALHPHPHPHPHPQWTQTQTQTTRAMITMLMTKQSMITLMSTLIFIG